MWRGGDERDVAARLDVTHARPFAEGAVAAARGGRTGGDGEHGTAGNRGHRVDGIGRATGSEREENLLACDEAVAGVGDGNGGAGLAVAAEGGTAHADGETHFVRRGDAIG